MKIDQASPVCEVGSSLFMRGSLPCPCFMNSMCFRHRVRCSMPNLYPGNGYSPVGGDNFRPVQKDIKQFVTHLYMT